MSYRPRPWHLRAFPLQDRERHQIDPDQVPPAPENIQPLGVYVGQVMKQIGLDQRLWAAQLADEWAVLVGDAVAAQTRPGDLEQGRLTIYVSNSMWVYELQRHSGAHLLRKLQARFGQDKIRQVSFRLDPGDGGPR